MTARYSPGPTRRHWRRGWKSTASAKCGKRMLSVEALTDGTVVPVRRGPDGANIRRHGTEAALGSFRRLLPPSRVDCPCEEEGEGPSRRRAKVPADEE